MSSFIDLAENLHHACSVHDSRRVGLFAVGRSDLVGRWRRHLLERAGRRGFQPVTVSFDGIAGVHHAKQQRDKLLIAAGIDQRALLAAPAHGCDGVRGDRSGTIEARPFDH